ncbi:MAG TPA: toll/interleukin-1 receptor domain-containing protein [Pyrinomonadaceae bacterium]
MPKIFISYSHQDRDFVRRLERDLALEFPEAQVFYDMMIPVGEPWAETLAAQIRQADIVLVVVSPDYPGSGWLSQELNVALERRMHGDTRIVPLVVRTCTPTGLLSSLTPVDFTQDYQEALADLIWGITCEPLRETKRQEPGTPLRNIDPVADENYHRETRTPVEHFKSRTKEPIPDVRSLFINYRSEDTGPTASRLYAELARELGVDQVFLDHERIEAGGRWPETLRNKVETADAMFVLIGKGWLSACDVETGDRRLNVPEDWVRQEIELALKTNTTIVPILVDEARPLGERDLRTVPSIQSLADMQALPLRRKYWKEDFNRIIGWLVNAGFTRTFSGVLKIVKNQDIRE